MDKVTRTTNVGDPFMTQFNLPVHATNMMVDSKARNSARTAEQYQSLYRPVYSDPCVNGRAAIKISSPLNYYGMNHFMPTPTAQTYLVGLPTGRGKEVLPPIEPRRQYTMSG